MKEKSGTTHLIRILATTALTTAFLVGVPITTEAVTPSIASVTQSKIKLNEKIAVQKFNQQFKNVKVDELQLGAKGNQFIYEVSGNDNQKEYTAFINAKSGKITNAHSKPVDNGIQKANLKFNKLISRKEANQIAEKAIKNGTGQSWTIKAKNGIPVWEVKVLHGHRSTKVKINAQSKKIINIEQDN